MLKSSFWRPFFAEYFGTFMLVFGGTTVIALQTSKPEFNTPAWLAISVAFALTLFLLIMLLAPFSGCHVNSVVTLVKALDGEFAWARVPGYWLSQFSGAASASFILLLLLKGMGKYDPRLGLGANGNPQLLPIAALFALEALMSCLFLIIILLAGRKGETSLEAALTISAYLLLAHLIGVPLSGASMNPARSFGPALFQGGEALKDLWLFLRPPY